MELEKFAEELVGIVKKVGNEKSRVFEIGDVTLTLELSVRKGLDRGYGKELLLDLFENELCDLVTRETVNNYRRCLYVC